MRINDIIEIVSYEGSRLGIRRVKVTRVRKARPSGCDCGNSDCSERRSGEQKYVIKAGNLHGKFERGYTLPLEPITETEIRDKRLHNSVNWLIPADLNGKADP